VTCVGWVGVLVGGDTGEFSAGNGRVVLVQLLSGGGNGWVVRLVDDD
jgi:hypothetical protein